MPMVDRSMSRLDDFADAREDARLRIREFLSDEVYEVVEIGAMDCLILGKAKVFSNEVANPTVSLARIGDDSQIDIHLPVLASGANDGPFACPRSSDEGLVEIPEKKHGHDEVQSRSSRSSASTYSGRASRRR